MESNETENKRPEFLEEGDYGRTLEEARHSVAGSRRSGGDEFDQLVSRAANKFTPKRNVDPAEFRNADGSVDHGKLSELADAVIAGKRSLGLHPSIERGSVRGGQANVEASLVARGDEGVGEATGRYTYGQDKAPYEREIARQEETLESYAKVEGIWLCHAEFVRENPMPDGAGGEALVYINRHSKTVTKLVNPRARGISPYGTPRQFLHDRISLFNAIFPEARYMLKGFTRDGKGRFLFVVEQPLIQGSYPTSYVPIHSMMMGKGFSVDGFQDTQSNGLYRVFDLGPKNVILTKGGIAIAIDAIPRTMDMPGDMPVGASIRSTEQVAAGSKAAFVAIEHMWESASWYDEAKAQFHRNNGLSA